MRSFVLLLLLYLLLQCVCSSKIFQRMGRASILRGNCQRAHVESRAQLVDRQQRVRTVVCAICWHLVEGGSETPSRTWRLRAARRLWRARLCRRAHVRGASEAGESRSAPRQLESQRRQLELHVEFRRLGCRRRLLVRGSAFTTRVLYLREASLHTSITVQ